MCCININVDTYNYYYCESDDFEHFMCIEE